MILVTGATGQLASRILDRLLGAGASAVGSSRNPTPSQRMTDFDRPATIDLSGVETLVLVSAGYAEDDVVVTRHRAVIDAAVRDGVEHVVYTSVTSAGDHLAFALAHRATERMLAASRLRWTVLRNGLYADLFGALLQWDHHGIRSPFGEGSLAAVTRDDLAAATAAVAIRPAEHTGKTYDLVGAAVSTADVADALGVPFRTISLSEYRSALRAGPPLLPFQPAMSMSIATSIRHGFLGQPDGALEDLIGRAPAASVPVAAAAAASLPTGNN